MGKWNDVSLKLVMDERNDGLLPFDILVEILSRLPGKQLMRFKCVSKSWFFLITDPAFVELHSSRSYHREDGGVTGVFVSSGAACIFDMKKEPVERVSVFKPSIPYDNNRTTNIVNGLICFYHESYDKRLIYLYNLTSRECISLPSTQVKDHPTRLPFQFSRTCLLGFDPITKEYKVLHFYSHGKNHLKKCQLLTIGAQKSAWRPLDISHIQGFNDFTCKDGFCVDGLLYWTEPNEIIVFDVGREMFKLIRFPQRHTLYCKKSGLVKLHNCLYLVEFYDPPSRNWWKPRSIVEIIWWRLKEGEDTGEPQWSKEVETCEKGSSFGYCFNHLGQMFSAHSSHSDTSIIEYYDLVTGNRQKFEVYNARGILDSSFRATKITDNIMPLRNALQVPKYSPKRENFNVSRGSR